MGLLAAGLVLAQSETLQYQKLLNSYRPVVSRRGRAAEMAPCGQREEGGILDAFRLTAPVHVPSVTRVPSLSERGEIWRLQVDLDHAEPPIV